MRHAVLRKLKLRIRKWFLSVLNFINVSPLPPPPKKTRNILYYAILGKFRTPIKFMRHNSDMVTNVAGNIGPERIYFVLTKFAP